MKHDDIDYRESMINERMEKAARMEKELAMREKSIEEKSRIVEEKSHIVEEKSRILAEKEKRLKDSEKAKKQLLLRLAPSLWEELASWAQDDFRSINGQIEYILAEAVKDRKKR